MLTENYKRRLQELAGLVLEDNTDKLKGFGINDEVAKFIVSINDKLAVFLANISIAEFAKTEGIERRDIKDILGVINQHDLLRFLHENVGKINFILAWLNSPDVSRDVNLKNIETLSQAHDMADAWHKSLSASGVINDESGVVVKVYPEGYYWIDLQTNSCSAEAAAMGHCGTDSRATTLISLRDKKTKEPHVTISYNQDTKNIGQVKGKGNDRPLPQYMKYVFDFLMNLVKEGKVETFNWSYRPDLTPEEIKTIFASNPEAYLRGLIELNLKSPVYTPPPFTKEEIINTIGREKYSEYVRNLLANDLVSSSFRLKLKRGEIIDGVGQDGYKNYMSKLIDSAIQNPNYRVPFSKSDIVKAVGEEKYQIYIDNLLGKVLENPFENNLGIETKDELFALLGQERYKQFVTSLVNKVVQSTNSENELNYVLKQQGLYYPKETIKTMVDKKTWFLFLKREADSFSGNVGAYKSIA